MKNKYKTPNEVSNKSVYGSLLIVFCMVLITMSKPLMGWVWVLCACAIAIAYVRIARNLPSVKNLTLNLLAVFCVSLLIYLSGSFGLMATMVNLLVVAACLKLINLQSRADYHLVLIVLFFLIACGFIYHQSIYYVAYYFACLMVLFVSAFLLNKGKLDLTNSAKQSSKMMLQAIPITLVLFVVTPRLPPFWETNVESNTQTGLSEQITPGDIANLAQSDELVFRAEFDDNIPASNERYWRSIVLDNFDGKTWSISGQNLINSVANVPQGESNLPSYRYLVIAEPNSTRWLYSLDIPVIEQNMGIKPIYVNRQYSLFQNDPSQNSSLYIVRSFTTKPLHNFIPETDFARYLQTPLQSNERTQQWVKENINAQMSFAEKLAVLNDYFRNNSFSYTLKPPLMLDSPIDAFLFDHKQGFCSHYASALTYMLRLSDVPARMVAGYQGGQTGKNNILTVRQFDAHAWVEAYDPDTGWVRYDPTSLVAPNRILSGLLSALNEKESAIFDEEINGILNMPIFDGLQETLAVIDHKWNQLIIKFNNQAQGSLIEKLFGELSRKNLTTFLLIAIAGIGIFLAILFVPYKKMFAIKRKTALDKVLKHIKSLGFERYKHETLERFHKRIENSLSVDSNKAFGAFISKYYENKYATNNNINEKNLMALYDQLVIAK